MSHIYMEGDKGFAGRQESRDAPFCTKAKKRESE
jgi:hypothetical protein